MTLVAAAMLAGAPGSAVADKWNDDLADKIFENFKRRDSRESEPELKVSLDQAVNQVRRQYGGKVIGAETRNGVHHVKLLSDEGRVRTVLVDGRTGRIR